LAGPVVGQARTCRDDGWLTLGVFRTNQLSSSTIAVRISTVMMLELSDSFLWATIAISFRTV